MKSREKGQSLFVAKVSHCVAADLSKSDIGSDFL